MDQSPSFLGTYPTIERIRPSSFAMNVVYDTEIRHSLILWIKGMLLEMISKTSTKTGRLVFQSGMIILITEKGPIRVT